MRRSARNLTFPSLSIFWKSDVAWLSSVRVLKCKINFVNERNPYTIFVILVDRGCKIEEGGD